MRRQPRTVHVDKITNTVKGVTYTSYYLRRSYRKDGGVGNPPGPRVPVLGFVGPLPKGGAFRPRLGSVPDAAVPGPWPCRSDPEDDPPPRPRRAHRLPALPPTRPRHRHDRRAA